MFELFFIALLSLSSLKGFQITVSGVLQVPFYVILSETCGFVCVGLIVHVCGCMWVCVCGRGSG